MHIIVVGCGFVGSQLAGLLSLEGHDVVIIDKNTDAFRHLGSAFNGVKICGYGFDEKVLLDAGILKCTAFAAVTDQDNTNVMAAEIAAKIFKVPKVVVRLYNPEMEGTLRQLGLDFISATTLVTQNIMERLLKDHGNCIVVRKEMELIEFTAGHGVQKKRVKEIEIPNAFRICYVTRGGSGFIPMQDSVLYDYDVLIAVVRDDIRPKISRYMKRG